MIQSGGWNRLRTTDEHSKLARVALDVPPGADDAFRTNVSKMSVALPVELRPALRAVLSGVVSRAQDAYRQRVALVPDANGGSESEAAPADSPEWRLGDDWTRVVEILERELRDDPDTLRRVLLALAGAGSSSLEALG